MHHGTLHIDRIIEEFLLKNYGSAKTHKIKESNKREKTIDQKVIRLKKHGGIYSSSSPAGGGVADDGTAGPAWKGSPSGSSTAAAAVPAPPHQPPLVVAGTSLTLGAQAGLSLVQLKAISGHKSALRGSAAPRVPRPVVVNLDYADLSIGILQDDGVVDLTLDF